MKEVLISLVSGASVGFLFAMLRLPIPAPPVLSGVVGVFGVFLGATIFHKVSPWLMQFFK